MEPKEEPIPQRISGGVDTLDAQRTQELEDMQVVQKGRDEALAKERKRLAGKYGENHPRVKKIDGKQAYNRGFEQDLQVETARTKYTPPEFDLDSWQVQGRVTAEEGKGVPDVTVALYTEQGRLFDAVPHDCTDENGYYALAYTPKGDDEAGILAKTPLTVTISDKDGNVLCRDATPVFIRAGNIDYRNIKIGDKDNCPPPPDGNGSNPPGPALDRSVVGVVVSPNNEVLPGVQVSLYDVNRRFDEKLGDAVTDERGEFVINYSYEPTAAGNENPDIFVRVLDENRNVIFTSEKEPRENAGQEEKFEIRIDRG